MFVMAGPGHFTAKTIAYAANRGVPLAEAAVLPLSGVIALAGGLSITLGFKAHYGAWLIVLFLVLATVMMHNYWSIADSVQAATQFAMFKKNLSMLGAARLIAHFGSGPLSLDIKGRGPYRYPPLKGMATNNHV